MEPTDLPQVRVAEGKVIDMTEKVELQFHIARKVGRKTKTQEFQAKFYVIPGLTYDLLLGTEFLHTHQAVTAFSHHTLMPKPLKVHIDKDVVIPAHSESVNLVALKSKVKVSNDCMGIVTGASSTERHTVSMAKVLTIVQEDKVPPNVTVLTLSPNNKKGKKPHSNNLGILRVNAVETDHRA